MRIDRTKGWTEAIINENCSIDMFHKIAGIINTTLYISFKNKINDTESTYWDFNYKGKELTLHYNIYTGISVFPKSLVNANNSDNQIVLDFAENLSGIFKKNLVSENFVSKYFEPEPSQWGLRGDPLLWRDMKYKTEKKNIPRTANEFEKMLNKLFKELTGEEPQKGKNIYVEKYETTGMSAGMICSDFWLEKGFSLLIQRYIENEQL
ncbi:hypothetical protein [Flavobacterium sp. U410]